MRYVRIIVSIIIITIIGGWYYRFNILSLFGNVKSISHVNTPVVALPPLTEAQKLEAMKAPVGMVYLPGGEYLKGVRAGQSGAKNRPQQTIYVSGVFIDTLEVTNENFAEFVKQNPYWQKGQKDREFVT